MSGGHGRLTEVYEGFGGRGRRLYRPFFFLARENEGVQVLYISVYL